MNTTPAQTHPSADDEYKKATKEVVDDMLRDDVLGPGICAVLTNHTPASTKIIEIIAEAIRKEPSCKKAIEEVIETVDTRRKSKWIDRGLGVVGTIIVGLLLWGIPYAVTHQTTSTQKTQE